jgi:hypothetical protein
MFYSIITRHNNKDNNENNNKIISLSHLHFGEIEGLEGGDGVDEVVTALH